MTIRILPTIAALLLSAACGSHPMPEPPEPAPATGPASARADRRLAVQRTADGSAPESTVMFDQCRCIRICIVRNGGLVEIPARYNTATGDTMTMDSLPFSSAAPTTGEYASVAGWYVNGEPIRFRDRRYTKHGLGRVLAISEVQPAGTFRGVPVFAEAGDTTAAPRVIYVPVRTGCEFQPYAPVEGR
ncbi:hypothetical protein [Longimicrobium sp.]|uniref:hypothetical protein n=1 Tax=Longimicrobium sp. TaxID=2029185 RepID=UPI002E365D8A|nr:hypothetical protein [Longimicrobium sp.]HEX6037344.1 hypothetical protein [Longimicrobium sp.]